MVDLLPRERLDLPDQRLVAVELGDGVDLHVLPVDVHQRVAGDGDQRAVTAFRLGEHQDRIGARAGDVAGVRTGHAFGAVPLVGAEQQPAGALGVGHIGQPVGFDQMAVHPVPCAEHADHAYGDQQGQRDQQDAQRAVAAGGTSRASSRAAQGDGGGAAGDRLPVARAGLGMRRGVRLVGGGELAGLQALAPRCGCVRCRRRRGRPRRSRGATGLPVGDGRRSEALRLRGRGRWRPGAGRAGLPGLRGPGPAPRGRGERRRRRLGVLGGPCLGR